MDIKLKVQIYFNQKCSLFKSYFSIPVTKFIRQMMFGILASKHIHLNQIGTALNERISLKKTTERLSRHLRRKYLGYELNNAYLYENKSKFNTCEYLVWDGSDIKKEYAVKMPGLKKVHDGSTGRIVNGYWLSNIVAASKDATTLLPAWSDLYSFSEESKSDHSFSENKQIIQSIQNVQNVIGKSQTLVIDRGGDRSKLITSFLENEQHFIIRQTGKRHLVYKGKTLGVRSIYRNKKRSHKVMLRKETQKKHYSKTYHCSALPVYFPLGSKDAYSKKLWLVTVQEKGKGFVWYLCALPDHIKTEKEVVEYSLHGYNVRWKIEELHREIKSDYKLEMIALQDYTALKNFLSIFFIAMSFIYDTFKRIELELFEKVEIKTCIRNKLSEYTGFTYYKITKSIQWLLSRTRFKNRIIYPKNDISNQLTLCF